MLISAVQKFTLLDYPGKVACMVFTPGCNYRCGYCHNAEFVVPEKIAQLRPGFIGEEVFFNFLKQRQKLLDGIVITGGEPTLMPDLVAFIRRLKAMNFLVKLDTNGSNPEKIKLLLAEKLLDYIALDVKTAMSRYNELVGPGANIIGVAESISVIKNSGMSYEFRATILKETHPRAVLEQMADLVAGAEQFYLQTFRPNNTLDQNFSVYHPYSQIEMKQIAQEIFSHKVKKVEVR